MVKSKRLEVKRTNQDHIYEEITSKLTPWSSNVTTRTTRYYNIKNSAFCSHCVFSCHMMSTINTDYFVNDWSSLWYNIVPSCEVHPNLLTQHWYSVVFKESKKHRKSRERKFFRNIGQGEGKQTVWIWRWAINLIVVSKWMACRQPLNAGDT